ncbi:hypothetical protein CsSME_00005290 [Camellia sinensis var. sinensis]
MSAGTMLYFPMYNVVELVNFVCDKFGGFMPGNVCLFFNIPGYKNISLQNDVDMQNMVHLAYSFCLQLIDVMVESRGHVGVTTDVDFVDAISSLATRKIKRGVHQINNEFDVDLLPNYCPHDEKTFLSEPWANGLTHMGQSFERECA